VRIVFIGTAPFACSSLNELADAHKVALVVTQPDRPAGRKHRLKPPAVKVAAKKLGLRVIQPVQINSDHSVGTLRAAEPEVIVVAAYGQLLRRVVFSLPAQGTINIHASLLPRYRGAAPIPWAIIRGDDRTGITTFLIDAGMDTGKILLSESLSIDSDETANDLHDRLAVLGSRVILRTLSKIESGDINPIPQQEKNASLAPKLLREDGLLDWKRNARELHNKVRGMNPWPGAFTYLKGEKIKLHRTLLTGIKCGEVVSGEIALREIGRLLVGTGDELLQVMEIQREGRPRTQGSDFLNGLQNVQGVQLICG